MSSFSQGLQTGPFVELLGTQGTNPLSQWKLNGPAKNLQKQYDKGVKGSVYACMGSGLKLQMPKDEKGPPLGLLQPYLVLQVSLQQVGTEAGQPACREQQRGGVSGAEDGEKA